ncbi:MAG: PD-(D/E)XK nuclease family protein, partial [Cyanobacteria bacterium]|nr:PD-(D/E)XK nuclease family protein [Cyanobacteriota bacterium]
AGDTDFQVVDVSSPEVITIGDRLQFLAAGADMKIVGDCVHAFLTVDDVGDSVENRLEIAKRVLANHKLDVLSPAALLLASDRLYGYLSTSYAGASSLAEAPVAGRLGFRRVRGTIDLLLEQERSFVIIDHKTFPGRFEDWVDKALSFRHQLALYRYLVEKAAGKPVVSQYIHMPIVGAIIRLDCRIDATDS